MAPHLPEALLVEAFEEARTVEKRSSRSEALIALITRFSDSFKEAALREALLIAGKIENEAWRILVLANLAPQLTTLPHHLLYPVWRATLHILATRTRRAFVNDLAALSPILLTLGGNAAIEDTIQSIEDVGQWWP